MRRTDGQDRANGESRVTLVVARLPRFRLWVAGFCIVLLGIALGLWRFTGSPVASTPIVSVEPDDRTDGPLEQAGECGATSGTRKEDDVRLVTYTVQPGDTLTAIAQAHSTSVDSIAYINGIRSPDRIRPGEKLQFIANASGLVVRVSGGDTLSGLSLKYGVPVATLVQANHLSDPDHLAPGQALILPGAVPAARPVLANSRAITFRWPLKGRVTSGFGWRIHPITSLEEFHQGIDVAAPEGTPILAAASGTISSQGWCGNYGRLVTIDHGDSVETRYGHLSGYALEKGREVSAGQVIGYVGTSGLSTGPHLHFEIRIGGEPSDPRDHLE